MTRIRARVLNPVGPNEVEYLSDALVVIDGERIESVGPWDGGLCHEDVRDGCGLAGGRVTTTLRVVVSASVTDEDFWSSLGHYLHAPATRNRSSYQLHTFTPVVGAGTLQRSPIRFNGGFDMQQATEGDEGSSGSTTKDQSSRASRGQGGAYILVALEMVVVIIRRQLRR